MTNEIDREKINFVTEHAGNYKQFNVALFSAYLCIKPDCISKICCSLFTCIISTLWYQSHKKAHACKDSTTKRIYSNIDLNPEILLLEYDPIKYKANKQLIKFDVGNFVKRLQQIDDLNIFYIWRCGRPYSYVFVMERDIAVWKYFNKNAFVTPKTINKIVGCSKGMINVMTRLTKKVEKNIIENSFGDFINKLISKMNPITAEKLPKWKGNGNIFDYLSMLHEELSKLSPYAGSETNIDTIINQLPDSIVEKILENKKQTKDKNMEMDVETLEKELTPENENLIVTKKRKKQTPIIKDNYDAKKLSFATIDPFSNCNNFLRFYYAAIRLHNNGAKLYSFDAERRYALEILDLLTAIGKKDDKTFLKSMIQYFIDNKLIGNNIYKPECTSLKVLKEIIPIYNKKYIS